jgi:acyl-coenzyme A synthetase/AMP-(fatty) acid ligase
MFPWNFRMSKPAPGAILTEEELVNHCAQFLGSFKKPRSVDFVAELPKNPNDKIADGWARINTGLERNRE